MKDIDSRDVHQSSPLRSAGQLGPVSIGLAVAAVEFALCGAILLALAALGVVPAATAVRWAVVILVPLSVTIGFLGIWAGILGWRLIPRSHGSTLVNASQAA